MTRRPRQIDLLEPASRIWKHATTLVDALVAECRTLEHDRWYLGGGTALAADWHHRKSFDIDILIAPGLSMAALHGEGHQRLSKVIHATNGRQINAPDQKLSIDYGNNGKVDIFSSGRQLPGHEEPIEIAGRTTLRLSNAQIFSGKFRRAIDHHVAARDLFDICHAARIKNDAGMHQALNALTQPELDRITEFWHSSRTKIEDEAQKKLSGISEENWIDPKRLAERAVRTTDTHRYAEVIIQAADDRTTIRTRTIGYRTNEYHSTANDIERDLHGLGIARYLRCHNISTREVIRDARKAMTQSIQQTIAHIARPNDPARGLFGAAHPPAAPPPATGFANGQDRNKDPSRGR